MILVTGASGFVGKHLVEALNTRGLRCREVPFREGGEDVTGRPIILVDRIVEE